MNGGIVKCVYYERTTVPSLGETVAGEQKFNIRGKMMHVINLTKSNQLSRNLIAWISNAEGEALASDVQDMISRSLFAVQSMSATAAMRFQWRSPSTAWLLLWAFTSPLSIDVVASHGSEQGDRGK